MKVRNPIPRCVHSESPASKGTTDSESPSTFPSLCIYIFEPSDFRSRKYFCYYSVMASEIDITTPNGHSYKQPTGLFINNEFVASNGQTITSLDPAYVSYNSDSSNDIL